MNYCDTAPLAYALERPWLGSVPQSDMRYAHFLLSPEGLQWYPGQLAGWSREQLVLLAQTLHHYASTRE